MHPDDVFDAGDIVEVGGENRRGKIVVLRASEAVVEFRFPDRPSNGCSRCGSYNLSQNAGTGEVVCMSTGCRHEHGFLVRREVCPLSRLKNISKQEQEEDRKKFRKELGKLLREGVRKEIIDLDTLQDIMSSF